MIVGRKYSLKSGAAFGPIIVIYADDKGSLIEYHNGVRGFITAANEAYYRIVPIKVKKEGWINVYSRLGDTTYIADTSCVVYSTEQFANLNAGKSRLTCIKIEWEEEE